MAIDRCLLTIHLLHCRGSQILPEQCLRCPLLPLRCQMEPETTNEKKSLQVSHFPPEVFLCTTTQFQREPTNQNFVNARRLMILGGCALLYVTLWSSNLYFNVTITNEHGETIKFRDSVKNLLNSPLWIRLKETLKRFWEYYWIYGWHNLWDEVRRQFQNRQLIAKANQYHILQLFSFVSQVVRSLDPLGEQNALSILGLPESATQQDITRRWRELSRKYHPDKFTSEEDKQDAQEKFMEIKEAYEKISVLHSKRKSQSSRTEL